MVSVFESTVCEVCLSCCYIISLLLLSQTPMLIKFILLNICDPPTVIKSNGAMGMVRLLRGEEPTITTITPIAVFIDLAHELKFSAWTVNIVTYIITEFACCYYVRSRLYFSPFSRRHFSFPDV